MLVWVGRLVVAAVVIDAAWLWMLWHNNPVAPAGPVPQSRFIRDYQTDRGRRPELPPLRWNPVALASIPEHVVSTFVLSEDARFFVHHGIDVDAIRVAVQQRLRTGGALRGASTITQQTAKNLFLTPDRSWLRKWHESVLTLVLEAFLSKARILEVYLNIAEFGVGVFGVDAAARHYWARPVSGLTATQAAELAASLPSPHRHNPATRTASFKRRAQHLYSRSMTETYPRG